MQKDFKREVLNKTQWETLKINDLLEQLDVDSKKGLSKEEVSRRLDLLGENKLPEEKKDGFLRRFLSQFNNSLIYVLLGAAVLTAFMGHWIDTWVILGVVLINSIVGYIQEDKAQKALDGIKHLLSLKASVIRDGKRTEVEAESLVVGDVVLLKAGDKVPADMRLINVSRFEVEEASLTGESLAVTKSTEPVPKGTVLGERESMTYTATTVRAGDAIGVVTATGVDTEVGKINTMLSETKSISTPLMQKINKLGKALSVFIILFSGLLILYSVLFTDFTIQESILSIIGLAVAAIPEGLPAILTITLAIGVQKMAKRSAIIRRLPSVETLGSVTVICSDKTGTLTKNEMTATNIYTSVGIFDVSGSGYDPTGEITLDSKRVAVTEHPILSRLVQSAYLCNDSAIENEDGFWVAQGAPTEAALKTLSAKAGYKEIDSERLDYIPFDSNYKYKASLNEYEGKKILFVNGAPERLVQICANQASLNGVEPLNIEFWEKQIEQAASRGQRLIGSAYLIQEDNKSQVSHDDLTEAMIFVGITGIIDPPRPEAIEAVTLCKNAGIRVKMITGDHVLTAMTIGMKMGIGDGETVISGADVEKMDDSQLQKVVVDCDIFARTSPEHKLRIVKALQAEGEIVAMTGDGVNDAPALKKADIGVAMGIKGTEVTKDSAEMVLADDNFSSIAAAVEEGRTIYDNLRKTLLFILPTNGAEALVIMFAIVFGMALPITPVQILWVNMVTAVTLGISLAFEPAEQNVMKRIPNHPKAPMLGSYFMFRILFVAIILGALTILSFTSHHSNNGIDYAYARTIAVNTLVFGELFYLFNCRKIHQSIFGKGFFGNRTAFMVSGILVLIQIGYTYIPFMNIWFETAPLKLVDWLYPIGGGIILLIIVEIEKFIMNRIRKNP